MQPTGCQSEPGKKGRDEMNLIQKSEEYFKRAKRVSPGGVHSPVRAFGSVGGVPRFIRSAQGAQLTDVDGNTYLDYCMSWGPLIFGHRDPEIEESVLTAIHKGWSYGTAEPYSLELTELICENMGWIESLRFVNSGTEAVMSALRLARAVTGRNKIIKFSGCYHGHTDSMLVKAGSGCLEMSQPDSAGVTPHVAAETLVAPLDDLPTLEKLFNQNEGEIAALIIEPVVANYGLIPPRNGFLKQVIELTKKNHALVIFDEVITGFRLAFGGMAELGEFEPDLVTYGKVIGGGFPVGAFGGKREHMEQVAPMGSVYQAGTLSANPVSMTAGLATLKKLKREVPYVHLAQKTEQIARQLEQIACEKSPGLNLTVRNVGSLFWLVFGDTPHKEILAPSQIPEEHSKMFCSLYHPLLERGIYLAPSPFEVGFLSTAHTAHNDDQFLTAFSETLDHRERR